MTTEQEWKRAGEAIELRRDEVGYATQEALAKALGVTVKWVNNIENARHFPYRKTYVSKMERLLRWEQGSVDRIVNGGEPVELPAPMPEQTPLSKLGTPELVARISEGLMELARRVPPGSPAEVDDYVPQAPARYDATAPVDQPAQQRPA